MTSRQQPDAAGIPLAVELESAGPPAGSRPRSNLAVVALACLAAVLLWVPRYAGPIDLRWDAAVYYILGTSLAEGNGYRLLSEPGEIEAVQYPPLLPAIVALHQLLLGTNDPTTVGRLLRLTSCVAFLAYAAAAARLLLAFLPPRAALLGTLLSLFSLQAWFLSDLLFPEVWFSVVMLLFLDLLRQAGSLRREILVYVLATAAYALRTIGLAALAVWVLDSVIRRRFRQAALRAVLALVPVMAWQGYVGSVERSAAYTTPAYEYQRASYMFYNVSYMRNIVLRDPFTPEKGQVNVIRRVARNALDLPSYFGETLSVSRRYFEMWLNAALPDNRAVAAAIAPIVYGGLWVYGGVLVAAGLGVLALRGQPLVSLYMVLYGAALCLTPFPSQNTRYLMPVAPLLALAAIVCLRDLARRTERWRGSAEGRLGLVGLVLVPALFLQIGVAGWVYATSYRTIAYQDAAGAFVRYRLLFYDDAERGFDEAVDYVRARARPADVVAAGMPHWIHLRTRLKTVMPPFEASPSRMQALLDSVPVRYLVIGRDVVGTERYTGPMLRAFPGRWARVFSSTTGGWSVYRRTNP
jgi:hypothetical protein